DGDLDELLEVTSVQVPGELRQGDPRCGLRWDVHVGRDRGTDRLLVLGGPGQRLLHRRGVALDEITVLVDRLLEGDVRQQGQTGDGLLVGVHDDVAGTTVHDGHERV